MSQRREHFATSQLPNLHGRMLTYLKKPLEDLAQHESVSEIMVGKPFYCHRTNGRGFHARPVPPTTLKITYRGFREGQHITVAAKSPTDTINAKNYITTLSKKYEKVLKH
jgi:hypothetical protein